LLFQLRNLGFYNRNQEQQGDDEFAKEAVCPNSNSLPALSRGPIGPTSSWQSRQVVKEGRRDAAKRAPDCPGPLARNGFGPPFEAARPNALLF